MDVKDEHYPRTIFVNGKKGMRKRRQRTAKADVGREPCTPIKKEPCSEDERSVRPRLRDRDKDIREVKEVKDFLRDETEPLQEDEDDELGGDEEILIPYGVYSGASGVPHPHDIVTQELEELGDTVDSSWCFACEMVASDTNSLDWQDLENQMNEFGNSEPTSIFLNIQRSYDINFKAKCEGKIWTLASIEAHLTQHGGIKNTEVQVREQQRIFSLLRYYVAENSCLMYDKSKKRIVPNTDGVAQYIKLCNLEQSLAQK